MLSLSSTLKTLCHNENSHSNGNTRSYYYRPKFLLAPDPSNLAHPDTVIKPDLSMPIRTTLGCLDTNTSLRSRPASVSHSHLDSTNVKKEETAKFPPPPALSDILRMEPELSPASAIQRAAYIDIDIPLPVYSGSQRNRVTVGAQSRKRERVLLDLLELATDTHSHDEQSTSDSRRRKRARVERPVCCCPNCLGSPSSGGMVYRKLFDDDVGQRLSPGKCISNRDACWLLAEWVSRCLIGSTISEDEATFGLRYGKFGDIINRHITYTIFRVIRDFQLSNTVVFLALWYIRRLCPQHLAYPGRGDSSDALESLVQRVFLLGIMFADKWLMDGTIRSRTWSHYCDLDPRSLTALELCGLKALDYNLAISTEDWRRWLSDVRDITLSSHANCPDLKRLNPVIAEMTSRELIESYIWSGRSPFAQRAPPSPSLLKLLHLELVHGLGITHDLSPTLPEPAAWYPAADPIIQNGASLLDAASRAIARPRYSTSDIRSSKNPISPTMSHVYSSSRQTTLRQGQGAYYSVTGSVLSRLRYSYMPFTQRMTLCR